MSEKDLFSTSCSRSDTYPECLVRTEVHGHNLKASRDRLDEQSPRLFCPDGKADVDIWEYVRFSQDFQLASRSSSFEIRGHFEGEHLFDEPDPECRYIFIGAPNSRDILRTSRKMLTYMLTYYQVMPTFLDFIFPFGLQEQAQDFHFSGFREETHLLLGENNLRIPELGRSGRDMCMCYSLKSVERSDAQNWPWSIRQTSGYHSFDVESGRSLWIHVKGNELIKERIQSLTNPDILSKQGTLDNICRAFSLTLETHLILCDWSVENWRWYMNYLETVFQDITSRSLAIRIGKSPSSAPEEAFQLTSRRTFSMTEQDNVQPLRLAPPPRVPPYRSGHPLPQGPPPPPLVLPPGMGRSSLEKTHQTEENEEFSFHDLQQVQSIEEKANEVLLVVGSNVNVLTELRDYYQSVVESKEWSNELIEGCKRDWARFSKRITSTITELRMHRSRAETLLRLLADRKSLLYGILEYRNMIANQQFTRKAQESASRMEKITAEMHEIATKTKQETVSMKIITLVTLFFLPGTFMSTIMSTDIIKWQTNTTGVTQRIYQPDALSLYLEITLPMMLLTFVTWGIVYAWVNRKENGGKNKNLEAGDV